MTEKLEIETLIEQRDRARDRFAKLGDLRPGSLSENYRKCGKPTCHCAHEGDPGHGPSHVLMRSVRGTTRSVRIRADEVDETRRQVDEYRRFREISRQFLDASEALADARSKARRAGAEGAPKKSARRDATLTTALTAELSDEIGRLAGDAGLAGNDFEALERTCRDAALGIVGRLVAARLNRDRSDTSPSALCHCGDEAKYIDRRPKTFTTALGPMTLERAWYHCDGCDHGFSTRDRALGLTGTALSPAVQRMIGLAAGRVGFAESSELLHELAGVNIDAKTVERHAEALGDEIAAHEANRIEIHGQSAGRESEEGLG